jgi:predicted TIM-barrel enzyme
MTTPPIRPIWDVSPLVIGALHLPDLAVARQMTVPELERYVLGNAAPFVEGGMQALMLQDQTRVPAEAAPDTLALMAALGRLLRGTFPELVLGIIIRAHDARGPIAVAHAVGASFVRIKVFAGGVMGAEGPRDGLGVQARAYRHDLRRDDIAILADVQDRTTFPRDGVPPAQAALWAEQLGADGLILTGSSFADSLARVDAARKAGVRVPILIGGRVADDNIGAALAASRGVIVSRSLMRPAAEDGVRWDAARIRSLMAAAA